jgi:hypothetical protein
VSQVGQCGQNGPFGPIDPLKNSETVKLDTSSVDVQKDKDAIVNNTKAQNTLQAFLGLASAAPIQVHPPVPALIPAPVVRAKRAQASKAISLKARKARKTPTKISPSQRMKMDEQTREQQDVPIFEDFKDETEQPQQMLGGVRAASFRAQEYGFVCGDVQSLHRMQIQKDCVIVPQAFKTDISDVDQFQSFAPGSHDWHQQHLALPPTKRLMWDEALAPTKLSEMLGQTSAKEACLQWWTSMKRGIASTETKPTLMLHGPPGTGKTLMIRLLAEHMGYRLLVPDLDGSGLSAKDAMATLTRTSLASHDGDSRPIAMLLEHADDSEAKVRDTVRSIVSAWSKHVQTMHKRKGKAKESMSVLVATCENAFDENMAAIRRQSLAVSMPTLPESTMKTALLDSVRRVGMCVPSEHISSVLTSCSGRMRGALLALQFLLVHESTRNNPLRAAPMYVDILYGPRDTARLAFTTAPEQNMEQAKCHLEETSLCLHAVLPASVPAMASNSQALAALCCAYDALSHVDMLHRTYWTDAQAYFVGRGLASPIASLRTAHGCGNSFDMSDAWSACPQYFVRKGQATKQLREARESYSKEILKGLVVSKTSEKGSASSTVLLPPNILSLDQVVPSANTLLDIGLLRPRKWISL